MYAALEKYKPKKEPYVAKRGKLLTNAKKIYKGREMIIDAFKNEIFPMTPTGFEGDADKNEVLKRHRDKVNRFPSKKSQLPTTKEDSTADDLDKMYISNADDLDKLLLDAEKYLDTDLIKKYFLASL